MDSFEILCDENCVGERLDAYIAGLDEPDISRSAAVNLIQKGLIRLNGGACKKSDRLKPGDIIDIVLPPARSVELQPQDIPVDIVYQDADIAVINKARGMVVHPSAGHESGTLVNALLFCLDGLSGINGELRPGIVHRLDKDTTGLIIVAKNDTAHRELARQFKERTCRKEYLALVEGNIKKDFVQINAPLARSERDRKKITVSAHGREAVTDCEVLERLGTATFVRCVLHTGRTHQIRVHLAHIGHPCLGDKLYGYEKQRFKLEGQLLHSARLEITHPSSGERMTFTAEPPEDFKSVVAVLENIKNSTKKQ